MSRPLGPWVWPETKEPRSFGFVSGWGAEGTAGPGDLASVLAGCRSLERNHTVPEGCGPRVLGQTMGLGWLVSEHLGAGRWPAGIPSPWNPREDA